jgi:hypothetical protein
VTKAAINVFFNIIDNSPPCWSKLDEREQIQLRQSKYPSCHPVDDELIAVDVGSCK